MLCISITMSMWVETYNILKQKLIIVCSLHSKDTKYRMFFNFTKVLSVHDKRRNISSNSNKYCLFVKTSIEGIGARPC